MLTGLPRPVVLFVESVSDLLEVQGDIAFGLDAGRLRLLQHSLTVTLLLSQELVDAVLELVLGLQPRSRRYFRHPDRLIFLNTVTVVLQEIGGLRLFPELGNPLHLILRALGAAVFVY